MSVAENNILILAFCAKRIGLTVFAESELIYFAVKTLQSSGPERHIGYQTGEMIKKMIREFAPKLLLIKSLNGQQAKLKNRKAITERAKKEAETVGILSEEISFQMVKQEICGSMKPTKANTFKTLSSVYPELERFVNHPSRWQKEYYDSLLSAAAIGFYYQTKAARQN